MQRIAMTSSCLIRFSTYRNICTPRTIEECLKIFWPNFEFPSLGGFLAKGMHQPKLHPVISVCLCLELMALAVDKRYTGKISCFD